MYISQIRPNHHVRLSAQIKYSAQEYARAYVALYFRQGLNAPSFLLGPLPSYPDSFPASFSPRSAREIYEVVISRNDLDRRESSAPSLLGRPPVARSPQGEKLRGFYSPISHELASWISRKSRCLYRSARASSPYRRYR